MPELFKDALRQACKQLHLGFDILSLRSEPVIAAVHEIVMRKRHTLLAVPTGASRAYTPTAPVPDRLVTAEAVPDPVARVSGTSGTFLLLAVRFSNADLRWCSVIA